MNTLSQRNFQDAVTSMRALEKLLQQDLEYVELGIAALQASSLQNSDDLNESQILIDSRTTLVSSIENIHQVLSWVKVKAPKSSINSVTKSSKKAALLQLKQWGKDQGSSLLCP